MIFQCIKFGDDRTPEQIKEDEARKAKEFKELVAKYKAQEELADYIYYIEDLDPLDQY